MARCLRGEHRLGLTYPKSFCRLRPFCPHGGEDRPPPLSIPLTSKNQVIRIGFPNFVPEIDVLDRRSWFWREGLQIPMIFVPLWQLLVNENMLSKASGVGLHDFLGFNGKIILSMVMPDELIDRLRLEDYFRLIRDLRPDATMIPDNYTYIDDPLFLSWSQTIRLVSFANDFLKLNIPVIGLVKGANLLQMDWAIKKQVEMGYVSFAMPARELFEEGSLGYFLPHVLKILKNNSIDFELLVYGVGRKQKYKGISYSNLSWFIEAKHGLYFKNGFPYLLNDPEIRFEGCTCKACNGLMPQELLDLWIDAEEACMKILIVHNLLDLSK